MMISKHKTFILSFFVTISLVQFINCEDTDPTAPTDLSASADPAAKPARESDAASNNVGTNKPKLAPAVNIVTTKQSSTTPMNGNYFCNMMSKPLNICKKFLGDSVKSLWQTFLKIRENIISIYRPPVTAVNNAGR